MTRAIRWAALFTISVLCVVARSYAQVPRLIRYQGQAVDSQSVPLEGPYTLTFRLYDAETGGAELWKETQSNVTLSGGHFSILLGQVTPLTPMEWDAPCWLSVQVNGESELSPRQQITSVPLAIRAQAAEQLTQPITPTLITPQGSGSGLDADTVDGRHAADLLNRANHTGTQPASTITGTFAPAAVSPQGSGSGLDADRLDGKDASQFASNPHTHQCVKRMNLPSGQSANQLCAQFGEWCALTVTGNGGSLDGCTATNPGFGDWGAICCK